MRKFIPFRSQISQITSFNRGARLFLIATILDGLVLTIWWLYFNFYILGLGYDREFLGLVNSVPAIAALLLGLPLGFLVDRIGLKWSMLTGVCLFLMASAAEVIFPNPFIILSAGFVGGAANTLYFLSQAPYMMRVSNRENRTMLFSLNFGLVTLSGALGNLLAGQLPVFFAEFLSVDANSANAYQAVLLSAIILGSLTLIPLWMIKEPVIQNNGIIMEIDNSSWILVIRRVGKQVKQVLSQRITLKLSLPNLLIGFGAAILIPYMNVFFREQFNISDQKLGVIFSISALLTGIGSIIAPRMAEVMGSKIRMVVFTQGLSLLFLAILGFSPYLWLAAVGFLVRGTLMNMAVPLYNAFSMEQVRETEQAPVNSIKEWSWQVGWAVGPYVSGVIQKSYGFTPLFITTLVLYFTSTLLVWIFFHNSENKSRI